MPRSAIAILLLLATAGCRHAVPASHPSADSVVALIGTRGVRAALDSMFRDPATDERWSDSIATGDSAWLHVASMLRSESDASISESLDGAAARALPNAPER